MRRALELRALLERGAAAARARDAAWREENDRLYFERPTEPAKLPYPPPKCVTPAARPWDARTLHDLAARAPALPGLDFLAGLAPAELALRPPPPPAHDAPAAAPAAAAAAVLGAGGGEGDGLLATVEAAPSVLRFKNLNWAAMSGGGTWRCARARAPPPPFAAAGRAARSHAGLSLIHI